MRFCKHSRRRWFASYLLVVVVLMSMPVAGASKSLDIDLSKSKSAKGTSPVITNEKKSMPATAASNPLALDIDLSKIAKGTSRVYAMPKRTCGDGTDYVFLVTRGENAEPNKNGKFEKVMIEFMGGGGCFDYRSCMGQVPNAGHIKNLEIFAINGMPLDEVITFSKMGGLIATTTNCMASQAGLLPCSSSAFADYVSLMIPYCTGDIHIGSQTATYYEHESTQTGASVEIRHHGANHTLDLLSAFIAAIGSPSEVRNLTVSGGSAGGWAALLWGGHIMEAFERAGSASSMLQTNVLVDSAFHVPLDKPEVAAKIFHGVKWGRVIISWQDQLIQPENVVAVLKRQLSYYQGRFRVAFLACDEDTAAQGFADYLFPTFGVDASYSRVAGMWNFLGEIHAYDATLGSSYGESDSRVFSYIADGVCHHPTRHREYMYKPPPGNELAPAMGDWVNTFLTTGFPYQVSPRPARVGGPSYTQYELCKATALAELKTDPHADKYWCCVQDFLKPGTTYQTRNFNGKHGSAPSATEWGCPAWTPPVIECVDDDDAAHKAALEYGVLKEGQQGKCKDFAHICEFLPDPSTNPCPLTCGLCIPGGMCERFDYDPPLTTLKIWKDDFCSSTVIGDNESAKVAIAKVTTKLCLPCDPRGTTDYVCPKGYSCTRNVLAGDKGCSEYCCTMCKLGEYCPEGSNNIVGKNDATICEEGSVCATPAQQIPCPLGYYCLGNGVNRSGAFEPKSCESLWESTKMEIDGKTLSAWDGLYCAENQTLPKLCDAGYYCDSRNGTTRKICPEGSFCPWGSTTPMPCPWPVHCVEGSAQQPITFFTILIVLEALIVKIVVSLYGPIKKLYLQAEHLVEDALSKDDHPDIRRKHIERMKRNRELVNRSEGRRARTKRRLRLMKTMVALTSKNVARGRLFSLVERTKEQTVLEDDNSNSSLNFINEQSSDEETMQVVPFTMRPAVKKTAELPKHSSSVKKMKAIAKSSRKSFTIFTAYRMPQKQDRISVEFENLVLTVGKTKKVINGVSGFIEGGAGVAIMGESGAGKTSLMNALAGRAFYGETTGVIKINGTAMQMSALKSMAAFVPQDDIVHSTLTVYENIYYAALFRTENPCVGVEDRQDHIKVLVDEAINIFMLNHVRNTIVGDVEKRGISGGQRKRVSVAMEIVGEPLIIFLDEPTSGLDATSSEIIMSALDQLNVGGITTVSVIHQPRYAVFAQFDHLFLLGTGGRMIYQGDPVASQVYFRNLGFYMPEGGNMADFICDIAVGVIECSGDPEFEPHQLFALWEKHEKKYAGSSSPREKLRPVTLETLGPRAHTSPFGTQLLLQLRMGGLIRWRGWFIILLLWNIYGIICMLHPLLMGPFNVDIPDYGHNILTITDLAKYYGAAIAQTFFGQIIAFMILFYTLYCTLSNALFGKTFHENKLIFWRESSSGYSILAFVLAQLILDCVHVLMSAFFCFFVFMEFRQPLIHMPYLWCWFIMLAWGLSGHIYFAQLLFPRRIATLGALVFILIVDVVFAGVIVPVNPEWYYTNSIGYIISFISTGSMALDSYIVSNANLAPPQYGLGNVNVLLSSTKAKMWGGAWYKSNDTKAYEPMLEPRKYHWAPLYVIFIQGLVCRIILAIAMHFKDRGRMSKPPICRWQKLCGKEKQKAPVDKTHTLKVTPQTKLARETAGTTS